MVFFFWSTTPTEEGRTNIFQSLSQLRGTGSEECVRDETNEKINKKKEMTKNNNIHHNVLLFCFVYITYMTVTGPM